MKISFVWYFPLASKILNRWRDGLKAAMEIIGKKHKVDWYFDGDVPKKDEYDFILLWDASHSPFFDYIERYPKARKGICLTTTPAKIHNLHKLDVIFVESQPVYEFCRMHGLRTIRAFGTDTDYFKPDTTIEKDIEYFYPATFSPWKQQDKISHLGKKLWLVGIMQPDGYPYYEACKDAGVNINLGFCPAGTIKNYYDRAKKVIIPAIHGSERTVLEAMSMNILPEIVEPKNERALSYLKEYKASKCKTPREFILKNYSHRKYAKQLLKGIEC